MADDMTDDLFRPEDIQTFRAGRWPFPDSEEQYRQEIMWWLATLAAKQAEVDELRALLIKEAEVLERAAEAMYVADCGAFDGHGRKGRQITELYRVLARAAIAAMRSAT